jgi:hypothetical protein
MDHLSRQSQLSNPTHMIFFAYESNVITITTLSRVAHQAIRECWIKKGTVRRYHQDPIGVISIGDRSQSFAQMRQATIKNLYLTDIEGADTARIARTGDHDLIDLRAIDQSLDHPAQDGLVIQTP